MYIIAIKSELIARPYCPTINQLCYIVCTHVYACVSVLQYYSITVFQYHLSSYYTLFYRHFNEYLVSFTLKFAMKRLQGRDTKIEIPYEVLIQSR